MLNMILIGGLVASLSAGPAAAPFTAATTDPGPPAVIDVVNVAGSGCPVGTAAISVSPDNTSFTVGYSNYIAQVGIGAKPTDFRKNCQISLAVHVPAGFTYALLQASHEGYAYLEPGATGQVRTSYYFQGQTPAPAMAHSFTGPMDDHWQITDVRDVASLVYAPCGEPRNLTANTEIRMSSGASDPATTTSLMTMDQSSTFYFSWKQCD